MPQYHKFTYLKDDSKALRADSLIEFNVNDDLMRFKYSPSIQCTWYVYRISFKYSLYCILHATSYRFERFNNFFLLKNGWLVVLIDFFANLFEFIWLNVLLTNNAFCFLIFNYFAYIHDHFEIHTLTSDAFTPIFAIKLNLNRNKLIFIG